MRSIVSRRVALASAAVLLVSAVAAPTVLANHAFSPDACVIGGDSSFTPNSDGRWAWAWFAGSRRIASGYDTLTSGVQKVVATPAYSGRKTLVFAASSMSDGGYVTCSS